jgi:hypothetical protein
MAPNRIGVPMLPPKSLATTKVLLRKANGVAAGTDGWPGRQAQRAWQGLRRWGRPAAGGVETECTAER